MSNPKQSERMIQAILDTEETPPRYIAYAYRHLGFLAHENCRYEETFSWLETGAEYVSLHPECGDLLRFTFLDGLATLSLFFGRGQEPKAVLDKLSAQAKLLAMPGNRIDYLNALSMYETNFGDSEKAYRLSTERLNLVDFYYGKAAEYYVALELLAHVLQDLGRYEQAKAAYEEILEYGESLGNLARTRRMSGKFDRERESLKEAAYGPDHPRPTAAPKKRSAQLQAQQA